MLKSLLLKYFSVLLSTSALFTVNSSKLSSSHGYEFGELQTRCGPQQFVQYKNTLTSCDIITAQRVFLLHSVSYLRLSELKKNILALVGPHQSP
jgi:hypothetical protein